MPTSSSRPIALAAPRFHRPLPSADIRPARLRPARRYRPWLGGSGGVGVALLVAAAIGISPLAVGGAHAAVLHVPGDYPSIQAAISAASSGDVVMVAEGEYFEEITLRAGVVVQGAGEERSIINGGGDYGDVVRAIGNDIESSAKLLGFTVTGAISGGGMPGGAGVFCNSGASPEIANCRFRGNDFGVATWNGAAPLVHNNVVVDNTFDGIDINSSPIVVNNTIAFNNIGIADGGGYRPPVMNNIVTNNTLRGISASSQPYAPTLSYNDVWGNGEDYHNCVPGTGDISEDPAYRDVATRDLRLSPGSPCIDSGNPDGSYNDPDGTRNDMGAYGGPGAESNAPEVVLTDPPANAPSVPLGSGAAAVFNVDLDPLTVHAGSVLLWGRQSGYHPGAVSYDAEGRLAWIEPAAPFRPGETVTALLTGGIAGAEGQEFPGYGWQFTGATADGSGELAAPVGVPVAADPADVAAADFNGDGHLDLVCGHASLDRLTILLGDGAGGVASGGAPVALSQPVHPLAADFDRDGWMDIAVACDLGGGVAVLRGLGDGAFESPDFYGFSGRAGAVAAGDLDQDGDIDLLVTIVTGTSALILANDGAGLFTAVGLCPAGMIPSAVEVGDFNGDGFLDAAIVNEGANSVTVRPGNGDLTFSATAADLSPGGLPSALALGDLNRDGALDLAVACRGTSRASVILGDGAGGFAPPVTYPVEVGPRGIALADMEADGDLDLVLGNQGSNSVSVLRNAGDGTFAPAVNYPGGAAPQGIVAADFDADGDLDLAAANRSDGSVSILLNQDALNVVSAQPPPLSSTAPVGTDVQAVFDGPVQAGTFTESSVRVSGAQSGPHAVDLVYEPGGWTLTAQPAIPFAWGEQVTVGLTRQIQAENGVSFGGFSWDFLTAALPSSGTFGGLASFNLGNDPRSARAGDFDRDGDIDLAFCSCGNYPQPGSLVVLRNAGDGTFLAPVPVLLGAPDPIDLFTADLDGDGDIDAAVAHNEPGSSRLVILRNNGSGGFAVAHTYAPATLGTALTGGDLDADGDVDLVVTDGWGGADNVHVRFNDGTGQFAAGETFSAGSFAHGVVAGDVDGDGDLDLAVANQGNDNVSVLVNDGAGGFPELRNYPVGLNPRPLCGHDFDGDGRLDLAAGRVDGVSLLRNDGEGGFAAAGEIPVPGAVSALAVLDADGDGDVDLAAACWNENRIWVARNDGSGAFAAAAGHPVGTGPSGLVAAELNGDQTVDLAFPIWELNRAEVLYNAAGAGVEAIAAPAPGELRAFPNPCAGSATILLGPGGAPGARLNIYDVAGRLVRRFAVPPEAGAGTRAVTWDGRDAAGRRTSAGVYFGRLEPGSGEVRIVRMR